MCSPLNVRIPDFGPTVDAEEVNFRLKEYKKWGYGQRQAGRPVPCWCLFLWIRGNNKAAATRRVHIMRQPRVRPEGSTSQLWQNWKVHQRNGGSLSFQEYQAKHSERKVAAGIPVHESRPRLKKKVKQKVKSSGGAVLRKPLQEILAKFAAMGKLKKPIERDQT